MFQPCITFSASISAISEQKFIIQTVFFLIRALKPNSLGLSGNSESIFKTNGKEKRETNPMFSHKLSFILVGKTNHDPRPYAEFNCQCENYIPI